MTLPALRLNGAVLEHHAEHDFLVASWTPRAGDRLKLDSTLVSWTRPTLNPGSIAGYHVVHAGPLVLGHGGESEIFLSAGAEPPPHASLGRIDDMIDLPLPEHDLLDSVDTGLPHNPVGRRQVLFRVS
jgi:hypothetical protein